MDPHTSKNTGKAGQQDSAPTNTRGEKTKDKKCEVLKKKKSRHEYKKGNKSNKNSKPDMIKTGSMRKSRVVSVIVEHFPT